jgi:hypothetical protein
MSPSIDRLLDRMHDQANRMPQSLFAFNRNGLRMAIAAIEDETRELHDEWQANKHVLDDCTRGAIRHELLDIAAVAMLAYEETFADLEAVAKANTP